MDYYRRKFNPLRNLIVFFDFEVRTNQQEGTLIKKEVRYYLDDGKLNISKNRKKLLKYALRVVNEETSLIDDLKHLEREGDDAPKPPTSSDSSSED